MADRSGLLRGPGILLQGQFLANFPGFSLNSPKSHSDGYVHPRCRTPACLGPVANRLAGPVTHTHSRFHCKRLHVEDRYMTFFIWLIDAMEGLIPLITLGMEG